MPTDKPRFSITLDEELSARLDEYKFSHRIKNQTQAVVSLIEKGLESLRLEEEEARKGAAPKIEITPAPEDAEASISLEESTALLVELGYIQPGQQLTDQDLAILTLVSYVMDNWFGREKP